MQALTVNALWQAQLPLKSENYGENVNVVICAYMTIRWISDIFDLLLTDSILHDYKSCKKKAIRLYFTRPITTHSLKKYWAFFSRKPRSLKEENYFACI